MADRFGPVGVTDPGLVHALTPFLKNLYHTQKSFTNACAPTPRTHKLLAVLNKHMCGAINDGFINCSARSHPTRPLDAV
jgi:hypothetical protein